MAIIWGADKAEHLARHNVTTEQADEATEDPDRTVISPDYASKTGRGIRTIGYSPTFGDLLSGLTWVDNDGATHGATAFRAKGKDRRYYEEQE